MKLWQKDKDSQPVVDRFTVGQDRLLDHQLAEADVLGSLAHATMLAEVGLLTTEESTQLCTELRQLLAEIKAGRFTLDPHAEDVHSQVEWLLTQRLGDTGKKIHSGRSRNDQVLVDIKLFIRQQIEVCVQWHQRVFDELMQLAEKHQAHLLPGYTHFQLAMPSSFGLWLGAYAEAIADDLISWRAAFDVANRNPLGSAAGFGSSFPLDRQRTTELLGFEGLHVNVVYAQMTRGKTERFLAQAMANSAATLARLSTDIVLYLNPHFNFVSFPDELTTGSSIMPHKKNPDVFELIRARCNRLQALPNEIALLSANLPSGYHRDFQLLKEPLFPAIESLKDCLSMLAYMLPQMRVREGILNDPQYTSLFSVEEVNRLVQKGVPFRDAYRQIGKAIEEGAFAPSRTLHHTHLGSLGNLGLPAIRAHFAAMLAAFPFSRVQQALQALSGSPA